MTASGMGAIGLAVTGGVFFNDLSNPDGSLALTNEVTYTVFLMSLLSFCHNTVLHVRAPVWTRVWATAHPQEGQEVAAPLENGSAARGGRLREAVRRFKTGGI